MYSLFHRLESKRKRVIKERQIEILKILLDQDDIAVFKLFKTTQPSYKSIQNGIGALVRDLRQLENLQAINVIGVSPNFAENRVAINLDWPQEIDEGEFLRRMKAMPKGKTFKFLS